MPFELTITFGGMCLLLRDTQTGRLQVLIPRAGDDGRGHDQHHGSRKIEYHAARLIYDRGRTEPGAGKTDKVDMVKLDNMAIDLTGLVKVPELRTARLAELADVNAIVGAAPARSLLGSQPDEALTARVTLDSGEVTHVEDGGIWRIGGNESQQMPIAVVWRVGQIDQDRLPVDLQPLHGGPGGHRVMLYPDNKDKLDLVVFHSPVHELPTQVPPVYRKHPPANPKAEHFAAFYTLYDYPPVPEFERLAKSDSTEPEKMEPLLGSMLTCMTGGGTI